MARHHHFAPSISQNVDVDRETLDAGDFQERVAETALQRLHQVPQTASTEMLQRLYAGLLNHALAAFEQDFSIWVLPMASRAMKWAWLASLAIPTDDQVPLGSSCDAWLSFLEVARTLPIDCSMGDDLQVGRNSHIRKNSRSCIHVPSEAGRDRTIWNCYGCSQHLNKGGSSLTVFWGDDPDARP